MLFVGVWCLVFVVWYSVFEGLTTCLQVVAVMPRFTFLGGSGPAVEAGAAAGGLIVAVAAAFLRTLVCETVVVAVFDSALVAVVDLVVVAAALEVALAAAPALLAVATAAAAAANSVVDAAAVAAPLELSASSRAAPLRRAS
jgi:hypothetical protein